MLKIACATAEVADDNIAKFSTTAAFQLKLTSSWMLREQDHTVRSNPMLTLFQELVLPYQNVI